MDHSPLTDDETERALRRGLARLADGASGAITDLDGKVARRAAAARRRQRALLGTAAGVVLVCGASGVAAAGVLSGGQSPPQAERGRPVVAGKNPLACPRALSAFTLRTAHPGIAKTMVPWSPSSANICAYAGDGARFVVAVGPAPSQLPAFTAQLDAADTSAGGTCARTQVDGAAEILVRFGYPDGAEVDVLVTLSGTRCPSETNGVLRGSLRSALDIPDLTDQGSSPAPTAVWTTTGNYTWPASSPGPTGQSSSAQPQPSQSSSFVSAPPSP